jgi:hypothetical protein
MLRGGQKSGTQNSEYHYNIVIGSPMGIQIQTNSNFYLPLLEIASNSKRQGPANVW